MARAEGAFIHILSLEETCVISVEPEVTYDWCGRTKLSRKGIVEYEQILRKKGDTLIRGDLLNCEYSEVEALAIYDGNHFIELEINPKFGDYGVIPRQFTLEEFPINYWSNVLRHIPIAWLMGNLVGTQVGIPTEWKVDGDMFKGWKYDVSIRGDNYVLLTDVKPFDCSALPIDLTIMNDPTICPEDYDPKRTLIVHRGWK